MSARERIPTTSLLPWDGVANQRAAPGDDPYRIDGRAVAT